MATHLRLPLALTGGGLATLAQDSSAEVAQSVALLLATRPGERRSVPDYGYEDPLFGDVEADEVAAAIETWETRADPAGIQITEDGEVTHVNVHPADDNEGA